jgi:hypothetical protein
LELTTSNMTVSRPGLWLDIFWARNKPISDWHFLYAKGTRKCLVGLVLDPKLDMLPQYHRGQANKWLASLLGLRGEYKQAYGIWWIIPKKSKSKQLDLIGGQGRRMIKVKDGQNLKVIAVITLEMFRIWARVQECRLRNVSDPSNEMNTIRNKRDHHQNRD